MYIEMQNVLIQNIITLNLLFKKRKEKQITIPTRGFICSVLPPHSLKCAYM